VAVHGLYAAITNLEGTPIPDRVPFRLVYESELHRLWHEAEWHQRRLVSLGCQERRVHMLRFLPRHSPARKGLLSNLSKAMDRDCTFSMGGNQIEVIAPTQSIEQLMAIIEAHDVTPVGASSGEASSK
jgi:hypothetical protein